MAASIHYKLQRINHVLAINEKQIRDFYRFLDSSPGTTPKEACQRRMDRIAAVRSEATQAATAHRPEILDRIFSDLVNQRIAI